MGGGPDFSPTSYSGTAVFLPVLRRHLLLSQEAYSVSDSVPLYLYLLIFYRSITGMYFNMIDSEKQQCPTPSLVTSSPVPGGRHLQIFELSCLVFIFLFLNNMLRQGSSGKSITC